MTAFDLYCILKLDAMIVLFCVLGGVGMLSLGICFIAASVRCQEIDEPFIVCAKPIMKHYFSWAFPLYSVCIIMATLLPSTKQMAALIILPKVVNVARENRDLINALPKEIINLGCAWLKELYPNNIERDTLSIGSAVFGSPVVTAPTK